MLRADPTRIDLGFIPGDPVDVLVPILDDNQDPVEITSGQAASWAAKASVRRNEASTVVLHEWSTVAAPTKCVIVPGTPANVHLLATSAETAAWQDVWPEWVAHWDLQVTPPGIDPQTIAAGQICLRPQYTH